jgi:hypothetical protein
MKILATTVSLIFGLIDAVSAESPPQDAVIGAQPLPSQDYPVATGNKNWGETIEGFQAALEFEKNEVPEGEPVHATVLIRNVSEKPLSYFVTIPEKNSRFVVTDQAGQVLAPRSVTKTGFSDRAIASRRYITRPGYARQFRIRLDELFDLQPGQIYSVRNYRRVPKIDSGTLDKSEVLSPAATVQITRKALNVGQREHSNLLHGIASITNATANSVSTVQAPEPSPQPVTSLGSNLAATNPTQKSFHHRLTQRPLVSGAIVACIALLIGLFVYSKSRPTKRL